MPAPPRRTRQPNARNFDVRAALHAARGVDLTPIHGIGPIPALTRVSECGTAMSKWPTARHFTSWWSLSPGNQISGGKVLSARTRRSKHRTRALRPLAAVNAGTTDRALGACYRRLATRVVKAKAVTATARKLAILFYNRLRHGVDSSDPGASYDEERHRQRVLRKLARRAKPFGYPLAPNPAAGVSQEDGIAVGVALTRPRGMPAGRRRRALARCLRVSVPEP